MGKILQAGAKAPDFKLDASNDETISLKDFRGKNVIIAFYPADWSPVCGNEIVQLNDSIDEFRKLNAELIAISVDGAWCHTAFAKDNQLDFPLLSDFEPKGDIAKKYGVYREKDGVCDRSLFIIDKDGNIAWSYLSPIAENPGTEKLLEALEKVAQPARK